MSTSANPLSKVLWDRGASARFITAGIAFLLGLSAMMIAWQSYGDLQPLLAPIAANEEKHYLVLHKEVSLAVTLGMEKSEFTAAEVDSLRQQPFIKSVGVFESNRFQATAEAEGLLPFYTYLFFESVPDAFLDEKSPDWEADPNGRFMPIIVSRDFLNLYNFGFALSQGLPQVPPSAVMAVPINVKLTGPKGQKTYKAQVVGFSNRISSILIPKNFMDKIHKEICLDEVRNPSRIIIEVDDAEDPALNQYLASRQIKTNKNNPKQGQAGRILRSVVGLAFSLGLLFVGLSLLLSLTTLRMVIAESRPQIALLLQIGYAPQFLATRLVGKSVLITLLFGILSIGLVWWAEAGIQKFIQEQGLELSPGLGASTWLIALAFISLQVGLSWLEVRRMMQIAGRAAL